MIFVVFFSSSKPILYVYAPWFNLVSIFWMTSFIFFSFHFFSGKRGPDLCLIKLEREQTANWQKNNSTISGKLVLVRFWKELTFVFVSTVESIFNSSNHRKRPLSMPKGSKQWGGTGVQPVPRFWRSRWGYYLRPKTPVWSSSLSNTSFGGYQWVKCRCRSWPSPESSEAWGDTSRGPVSLPWNWREGPSGKSKPFSINCRELETLRDISFWHCHDKLAIIMTIEWKCNPIFSQKFQNVMHEIKFLKFIYFAS